jgi:hypothetical protein
MVEKQSQKVIQRQNCIVTALNGRSVSPRTDLHLHHQKQMIFAILFAPIEKRLQQQEASCLKSDANPLPLQEHNNTEFSKSSIKSQPRKIIEDNEDSEYATAEPDEDLYSLVGDGDQDDIR